MDRSSPPRGSNVLVYVVLALVGLGICGFAFLLFGQLFVIGAGVMLIVGMIGGLHYLLWGRSMTEQAKKQAKSEIESGD